MLKCAPGDAPALPPVVVVEGNFARLVEGVGFGDLERRPKLGRGQRGAILGGLWPHWVRLVEGVRFWYLRVSRHIEKSTPTARLTSRPMGPSCPWQGRLCSGVGVRRQGASRDRRRLQNPPPLGWAP